MFKYLLDNINLWSEKFNFFKNFLDLWNVTIFLNIKIEQYFINLYIYSYDFNNEIIIQKIYAGRYIYMWKFETIYSMKIYTVNLLCFKNR